MNVSSVDFFGSRFAMDPKKIKKKKKKIQKQTRQCRA